MLSVEHSYKFIKKHIDTCTPVELYHYQEHFYNTFWGTDCPEKTSLFGDSLWYLKRLVIKYRPEVGMVAVAKHYNDTTSKQKIEDAYIYYLTRIAAADEFFKDYVKAAYFAKKALDMVGYFHPYLNQAGKEKMWKEHAGYRSAMAIYNDRKEHLTEEIFNRNRYFDWEYDFYLPLPEAHANQNFTGLVAVE